MKYSKKILAAVIATLFLVLSCTAVFANDYEEANGFRTPPSEEGYLNGYKFTFSTSGSSNSLVSAAGTYGISANLKIEFTPTFGVYNNAGQLIPLTISNLDNDTVSYGPFYGTSISKSYTVSAISKKMTVNNGANTVYNILIAGSVFYSCIYRYKIGSTTVSSLSRFFS